MLSLTSAAATKIQAMAGQFERPDSGIRIMVVGGGCSGLTYDMDFEDGKQEGDLVVDSEGVTLYVDPMSIGYLEGTRIDYVEDFTHSGFRFENPNAQKSCGCGSSFTV